LKGKDGGSGYNAGAKKVASSNHWALASTKGAVYKAAPLSARTVSKKQASGTASEAADFFASQCARHHLYDNAPEAGRVLGLPPGFRFLLAGDYLDVFDEKLFDR